MLYLVTYGAIITTLGLLDALWLGVIARPLYKEEMGHLLSDEPKIIPIVVFYLMYAACITYLVVRPWALAEDWKTIAIGGAVLGFAAYGAYDMTNLAVLKNWPLRITFIDWAWGTCMTALASTAGYFAVKYFLAK